MNIRYKKTSHLFEIHLKCFINKECFENNILISLERTKRIRSCRDVACYVSTVHLPQNEQYQ
jgi:hypothetical protein